MHYQTKLEQWAKKNQNCLGTKEQDIALVEQEFNIVFPQAYREFLLIAGEQFSPYSLLGFKDWIIRKKINNHAKEWLDEYNIELDGNYWVIAEEDGALIYFFLNGDENPKVYICEMENKDDFDDWHRIVTNTFSEFIEDQIDHYKKYDR